MWVGSIQHAQMFLLHNYSIRLCVFWYFVYEEQFLDSIEDQFPYQEACCSNLADVMVTVCGQDRWQGEGGYQLGIPWPQLTMTNTDTSWPYMAVWVAEMQRNLLL